MASRFRVHAVQNVFNNNNNNNITAILRLYIYIYIYIDGELIFSSECLYNVRVLVI
jgi:hypothetical protein